MRTLLLTLLLAPLASAQPAEQAPRQPSRPLMALAGVGGTLVTMTAFGAVLSATVPGEGEDPGAEGAVGLLMLAAIPAGTALGVRLVARQAGEGESFGRTYWNAALGMVPAFALGAIASPLIALNQGPNDPSTDALVIVVVTLFVVGPGAYAAMRYRGPTPTVAYARTPDGSLVPVARVALTF